MATCPPKECPTTCSDTYHVLERGQHPSCDFGLHARSAKRRCDDGSVQGQQGSHLVPHPWRQRCSVQEQPLRFGLRLVHHTRPYGLPLTLISIVMTHRGWRAPPVVVPSIVRRTRCRRVMAGVTTVPGRYGPGDEVQLSDDNGLYLRNYLLRLEHNNGTQGNGGTRARLCRATQARQVLGARRSTLARPLHQIRTWPCLFPKEGIASPLLLQGVPEAKVGKNRMHLDIVVDDIEAEVHRLRGLGAHPIDECSQSFGGPSSVRMTTRAERVLRLHRCRVVRVKACCCWHDRQSLVQQSA